MNPTKNHLNATIFQVFHSFHCDLNFQKELKKKQGIITVQMDYNHK